MIKDQKINHKKDGYDIIKWTTRRPAVCESILPTVQAVNCLTIVFLSLSKGIEYRHYRHRDEFIKL